MSKQYSLEYKEYVAKMVVDEGRKMSEVSYELEIPSSTMSRWISNYREKKYGPKQEKEYITPSEFKKLKRDYEKKLRDMEEENEILKKAMHIFTKGQE
ncbi:transposase [Evansella halocellulosilytica]|uniref:transposase n=1 Tax=Evansella halocellulosilytica TaxID=2011013 RepID=UPI000BB6A03B|nr:transposase [Evansella halocellulosilytica]